ncbi:MAG TPA: outer membrane beta-barrel family protein [Flavobacterium sp.]|jgi:hypothetical protein
MNNNRFKFTYLFAIVLFAVNLCAQEQSHELRGKVQTAHIEEAALVTLRLLRAADSTFVKAEVPDASGAFLFEPVIPGDYILEATLMGYEPYKSEIIHVNSNLSLAPIILKETTTQLAEVTVQAKKPFITRDFEKTVLNVEGSIMAAGSTALEILEKAPGITIDQNDNISMRGRQGVMVMIDGKRVQMSGAELVTLLRATPGSSIEKIDLVTNPSAKYDAQGNAGIIDIRLKKDNRTGTNGTLTGSFGQGIRHKASTGVSLNNRTKKFNTFGSYNFSDRGDVNKLWLYRRFYSDNAYTGAYNQKNKFLTDISSHNYRAGADYYLSEKTIIGAVATGTLIDIDRRINNRSLVYNPENIHESSFFTTAESEMIRRNNAANLNLKQKLGTKGSELSADVDYAIYKSTDNQFYTTRFADPENVPIQDDYLLHGELQGVLDIKSIKADYNYPIDEKTSFEAGAKSSWVKADNDIKYFDRSNGGNVLDETKSNHFIYHENINAAYVNVKKAWEKFDLQLGLRLENTITSGEQLTDNTDFNQNYTQLFPSFYTGYRINEKHEIGISLSRRINRPTYYQLNPFRVFLDPSTYSSGNPYLTPELTDSFELTYTLNQKIITKLGYSHTKDGIVTVLAPVAGEENVILQTDSNLAKVDYFTADITIPFKIGKWLESSNNLIGYYARFRGNLANTNLDQGLPSFSFTTVNRLALGNNYSGEVNADYQSQVRSGFLLIHRQASLSFGVQKQIWEKKASIKLNVADVFYSRYTKATTELTGYKEAFRQERDTRTVTLSFTYRFGKNQLAPARRRQSGAEEEQRRAS